MVYDIDLSDLDKLMNLNQYDLLRVQNRYLVSYGGASSGKSVGITQKLLLRLISEPKHRILVARKTARSLKKSVYQLFLDVIELWSLMELFVINKTDLTITCKPNGNQILFTGLDDSEKLKSIAGITGIWVEEATEVSLNDFMQLDLRLRGATKRYKQFILTFNPTSSNSWLKKRFFDTKSDDVFISHSTYKDNRFVDDSYKKVLEELIEQDANFYRIYALGEWGVLEGLIYDNYQLIDSLPDDYEFMSYGIDFGFVHPMALVEVRVIGNGLYIQEHYYESHTTTDDLIKYMNAEGINKSNLMYCDSAEPDRIETIKRAGFNVKPALKNVMAGIDYIKSKNIFITKDSNNIIKELDNYKWKKDKDGNNIEVPIKLFDDSLDALRYAVFTKQQASFSQAIAGKRRGCFTYKGF